MVYPLTTGKTLSFVVEIWGMAVSDENTRPKIKLSRDLYKESREIAKGDGRSWSSYVERLIAQDVEKKKRKRGN